MAHTQKQECKLTLMRGDDMRDMKNDRVTWRDRHADGIYMAKTAGGMLVIGLLGYALCVAVFVI